MNSQDLSMPPEHEEAFRRALELNNGELYEESLPLLESLARLYPANGKVQETLAAVYYLLKRYPDAEQMFQRVVKTRPRSERASIALFHTLMHLERDDEAFDEARRFVLAGGKSEEYKRLFKEMVEELSARGVDTNAPEDE